MGKFTRTQKVGACCGFVISVLVLLYGYLRPHFQLPAINDWFILIACPPSVGLMALDNAKWYDAVVADFIVVLANTAWYGALFGVAAQLFPERK